MIDGKLVNRCTIKNPTSAAQDGTGEVTTIYTSTTLVPCLFGNPKGGRALTESGTWVNRATSLILAPGVTVTEKSLIVGTSAPGFEHTYRVASIQPVITVRGVLVHYYLEVEMKE